MPNKSDLIEYRKKAQKYLSNNFDIKLFQFNHFGIKANTKKGYQNIRSEIQKTGVVLNEVFWNDKHITTVKDQDFVYEISEPKPNKNVGKTKIDHVSFICKDFRDVKKSLRNKIVGGFDVGESHGIKISPEESLIIEIRNDDIIESVNENFPS